MRLGKNPTNKEIAQLLYFVAVAYEIKDKEKNRFKVIAYERAAQTIETLGEKVKGLWQTKKIKNLPGIGESITNHLSELFETGQVKHFQKIFKGFPPAMFEFTNIKGIGPKTAYKLSTGLEIKSSKNCISRLSQAAKSGKIRNLEGFGEESEKQIIKSIASFRKIGKKKKRMLISHAENLAREIIDYLEKSELATRIEPLGSLRRKCETIGDIDIAAATMTPKKLIDWFVKYPKTERVLEKGDREASIILTSGDQVDLITQRSDSFGSLLQHFTGSKEHNINLRKLALSKNLSLSEYGIKKLKTKDINKFANEEDFYCFLGLDYIQPELRENIGEIELARQGRLPNLLKIKDIRGDLHIHSNFPVHPSHDLGKDSMDDVVKQCVKLKYQYLAFSEHNPSQKGHTDAQIISIIKRKKERISHKNQAWQKNNNFFAFNSLEIDIKPNGQLALPKKAFDYLDFVAVSIHSSLNLNKKEMTKRILLGLNHPKAKILGHPTGRKLLQREGYQVDWEKIFEFCRKNNKVIEINASPKRLDLPANLIRQAIKYDLKFSINSDAHSINQLKFIKYGVFTAQKSGLAKASVINTFSLNKIAKLLEVDISNLE